MRRVSVVGAAGSGKTTLARRLAAALRVTHVELDALYWGPGWKPRPREDFVADAHRAVAGDGWVVDGNYARLQPAVWARADTVVWLDLPARLVLRRLYGRTLRSAVNRGELWPGTGNRQSWRDVLRPLSEESIVCWSREQLQSYPAHYQAAMADPANAHLTFWCLRTRRDVERFLAQVNDSSADRSENLP
jgi:adenylate kinase family enzyme